MSESEMENNKCEDYKSSALHATEHNCDLDDAKSSTSAVEEGSKTKSIQLDMTASNLSVQGEDFLVEETKQQEDSDFSDDETGDQWTLSSVVTWFSSAETHSSKPRAKESQSQKNLILCADDSDCSLPIMPQSLSPIKRPGIDPEESVLNEDDASVSNGSVASFVSAFGFGFGSGSTSKSVASPKRKDANGPIGKVKSLLDAPSSIAFNDDTDRALQVLDNLDIFFLQTHQRPDPPGSVSSQSHEHNASSSQRAPTSGSSSDAGSAYCETHQSRLEQRLEGGFLSEQLSFFLKRNKGSNVAPQNLKPLLVKSSTKILDTTVDTTSDNSFDKNSPIGHDKIIEEVDESPCWRSWKVLFCALLLFGVIIFATLISVSSEKIDMSLISMQVQDLSIAPTLQPSSAPSNDPSSIPSSIPSDMPSLTPSSLPTTSLVPSVAPSKNPSSTPSQNPTYEELETTFYAIGDVPYRHNERVQLKDRMKELPTDAEFLIHLGDIRTSGTNQRQPCLIQDYQEVHNTLRLSKVPVFIIPGDNEWNDCPNHVEAKRFWTASFNEFDKNWDHSFQVQRHPVEPENFFFVHKRTLYFGLRLLGGRIRDRGSFNNDLRDKFEFVKSMIDQHVVAGDAVNVVIFGHAFPVPHHDPFFGPLRQYMRVNLNDKVPILYLNGDYHFYQSQKNYMGFSNFNRLQVAQGTAQPPLKIEVTASNSPVWNATEAFKHDRMLWLSL
ncbi:unnamed protein product [Cylindrotheca closterium]|uniref:Calcineurin-like phosphoesterase domain-containing protein n=1 Tax=Cylindrotheca closterium TaxID=2856 RepID=A0AAD2G5T6_9STRA|nr:unnamed protein product [Cylindrotheca closterium]